jgi:hypothetical protein
MATEISYLRGRVLKLDAVRDRFYRNTGNWNSWQARNLQDAQGNAGSTETEKSFPVYLSTIVAISLILIFITICTFHCLKGWVRRKLCGHIPNPPEDAVLVQEVRAYNLSDDQRRAVLEAIFSEISKVGVV